MAAKKTHTATISAAVLGLPEGTTPQSAKVDEGGRLVITCAGAGADLEAATLVRTFDGKTFTHAAWRESKQEASR